MSQFEQENDLGRGGGEVDDETMREGWKTRRERGQGPDPADEIGYEDPAGDDADRPNGG